MSVWASAVLAPAKQTVTASALAESHRRPERILSLLCQRKTAAACRVDQETLREDIRFSRVGQKGRPRGGALYRALLTHVT
ncbi:MAG: hypothetical protein M3Q93_08390 [Gemmatimonadota bacterium]|nr:hypothetical protein [Gemmatimonadota bacterium]